MKVRILCMIVALFVSLLFLITNSGNNPLLPVLYVLSLVLLTAIAVDSKGRP